LYTVLADVDRLALGAEAHDRGGEAGQHRLGRGGAACHRHGHDLRAAAQSSEQRHIQRVADDAEAHRARVRGEELDRLGESLAGRLLQPVALGEAVVVASLDAHDVVRRVLRAGILTEVGHERV
jgi:hypothetical protein